MSSTKETKPKAGRSLEEFRSSHDKSFIVPNKIKAALATIDNGWVYEGELVKLAGISPTDLGVYRSLFEEHIVMLKGTEHGGKRAWAGTKAAAEKMRGMLT